MTPYERREHLIRQAMNRTGLTVAKLSRAVGITPASMYAIFNGESRGKPETILKITNILGVASSDLLLPPKRKRQRADWPEAYWRDTLPLNQATSGNEPTAIDHDELATTQLCDLLNGDPDIADRLRTAISMTWRVQFAARRMAVADIDARETTTKG